MLSINPIDREGKIKSEITRYKIPYPVLIGRASRVIADYGIKDLPHLFIIDKEGKIVFQGKFLESEKMEEILNPLVKP